MNTKSLLKIFGVVALVAVVVATYYFQNPGAFKKQTVLEQAQRKGANEVSLNGKVLERTAEYIRLQTGYMSSTATGTKFVDQEKKVNILGNTEIYRSDETTIMPLSEIYSGAVITIYIPISTVELQEVTASKVILNRQ